MMPRTAVVQTENSALRRIRTLVLPGYLTAVLLVWGSVTLLYTLGWSRYFTEPVTGLIPLILLVLLGTVVGFALLGGRLVSGRADRSRLTAALSSGRSLAPLYRLIFIVWAGVAAVEIVLEGVPPLFRSFMGQGSDYNDYGLPSIHGLLLAMACALALIEQAVRLNQGRQPFGPYTLVICFWLLLLIGRKHMIVIAVQLLLLLLAREVLRLSLARMMKWTAALLAVVFVFGFLGDFRSNAGIGIKEKLKYIGPEWVPDAFVWIYSYLATPLANWQNAHVNGHEGNDLFPWRVFAGLLPTVWSGDAVDQVVPGGNYPWLLTSSFNVSTGFIVPLVDSGMVGVFLYALLLGLVSAVLLGNARGLAGGLAYLVAYQCTIMMIFNNNFGNLNTVFQIPLLLILGQRMIAESAEPAAREA
ncbi:O-antigen polymerase [Agromyces sp. LHK192]|uniref:O-antigen polymerase n=1 Tax=Agromyces sp. LHK192 TaxID=2498704 RepID=UPI000FD9B37E|nr:O-antigen polymerase [Agromyces sp. LHK192]